VIVRGVRKNRGRETVVYRGRESTVHDHDGFVRETVSALFLELAELVEMRWVGVSARQLKDLLVVFNKGKVSRGLTITL
jgi:hypothetical protein